MKWNLVLMEIDLEDTLRTLVGIVACPREMIADFPSTELQIEASAVQKLHHEGSYRVGTMGEILVSDSVIVRPLITVR